MSRLANDLLTLARLDAGRLTLEREVMDLGDLAYTLVHRVSVLAGSRKVSVELLADDPGQGGRPLVFADPQYTEEAGLILVEKDTGPGIAKEHLARLGERFFRADASRNRATGGSGLGLAIAFRIARAHGGAVQIESELGKGTNATLSLPVASL
jgi:signal transduction histidine kinase